MPRTPTDEGLRAALEVAEHAVSQILADASEEARRHVEDAHEQKERVGRERSAMMSAVRDALLEQATTVKHQAEMLIATLDLAIDGLQRERKLDASVGDEPPAPEEPRPPAAGPPPGAEHRERALQELRERMARAAETPPGKADP